MVRFRLFGIPFAVAPYFWIGTAILGSGVAHGDQAFAVLAIWMGCAFVSIVAHELGHALMARQFGITPYVQLNLLGGQTWMPGSGFTRSQGMLVTLAGPAVGLAVWVLVRYVVAGAVLGSGHPSYIAFSTVEFLIFINLVWTLFNLLPILPLDGGQFVSYLAGPRHIFFVRMLGGTMAAVACAGCLYIGQTYAAIFLGMLAVSNFRGPVARVPAA
jgi:Zn-dependent protease